MQITLRAVRMYGTASYYGPEPKMTPSGSPIVIEGFPQIGERVCVHFGAPLEEALRAERIRKVIGQLTLNAIFGGQKVASSDLDAFIAQRLETSDLSIPNMDRYRWFATLIVEREISVADDLIDQRQFAWLEPGTALDLEKEYVAYAAPILETLTTCIASINSLDCFDALLIDNRVYFDLPGREVFGMPHYSMGKPTVSVSRADGSDKVAEIEARLRSVFVAPRQQRDFVEAVRHWYVAALTEQDEWKQFLWSFLALETLIHKWVPRLYNEVLGNLAVRVGNGSDLESVPLPRELMPEQSRLTLLAKFTVLALAWFPQSADQDVQEFAAIKKVRDDLAHGQLAGNASLPVHRVRALLKRYLATAMQHQFG